MTVKHITDQLIVAMLNLKKKKVSYVVGGRGESNPEES